MKPAATLRSSAKAVRTGSLWLTVEEAEAEPAQKASFLRASSADTVRTRAWTGKSARVLRNDWTEAWDAEGSPAPLPMPIQGLLAAPFRVFPADLPDSAPLPAAATGRCSSV